MNNKTISKHITIALVDIPEWYYNHIRQGLAVVREYIGSTWGPEHCTMAILDPDKMEAQPESEAEHGY